LRTVQSQGTWWRTAAWLVLALLAVGTLPYAFAWGTVPPDLVYTGLMFDVPDHAQYWSWITASRDGLFISNAMTPEPNAPIFMNPMMWTLARLQSTWGLDFAALHQVWRLLAVLVLAASMAWGFRVLVAEDDVRRTALWTAAVGAGFGWLLVVAKKLLGADDVPFPHDLYTVEPNTLFASYAYPYLALAQGLVLAVLAGAWHAHATRSRAGMAVAVVGAVLLALSHPYDLITVYAVLGVAWLGLVARTRAVPWTLTVTGALIALSSGPVAVYYRALTAYDPLWQDILAQYANAGVWTPPHIHLVVLMGLPAVLAAVALPAAWRASDARWYLAIWSVVGLGLAYLPVVFQIKMLTAWQFPLAILAAHLWHGRLFPWLWSRIGLLRRAPAPRAVVATVVLVVAVVPTNLYLLAWRVVELRRHAAPYYLHEDEREALGWLAANATPDDVVIAPLDLGQYVPNYGEARAYLAHWAMTRRFFERRDNVARVFDGDVDDAQRAAVLDADAVTLLMHAPQHVGPEAFDPSRSPLFEPAFVRPRASVYRYRAPASAGAAATLP